MSEEPWVLFDGDNYEKQYYMVRRPSGEIVRCYPNAGMLHVRNGTPSDEVFCASDNVYMRPETEEEEEAWEKAMEARMVLEDLKALEKILERRRLGITEPQPPTNNQGVWSTGPMNRKQRRGLAAQMRKSKHENRKRA